LGKKKFMCHGGENEEDVQPLKDVIHAIIRQWADSNMQCADWSSFGAKRVCARFLR
jgi:hypothetical protein